MTTFDQVTIEFGQSTALDVLDRLVTVSGLDIVDVGCGGGDLARALVTRGARVTGIEPDGVQAGVNAKAPAEPNLTFQNAAAEAMPLGEACADGIFFNKSLHHVPVDAMEKAISESLRVLRHDGFLYVMEPDVDGAYSQLMRPFHDETEVRHAARATLRTVAEPAFDDMRRATFSVIRRHENFDEFVSGVMAASYNSHDRDHVESDDVRACFDAGWDGETYSFEQPMTVFLFAGKSTGGT